MVADEQLHRRLRALFEEELEEGLELLRQGLLRLDDTDRVERGELVRELFRTAHSLKGAAHAAAVPDAVTTCDRLETTFAAIRDGLPVDHDLVTQLLGQTDALAALASSLHGEHEVPPPARSPATAAPPGDGGTPSAPHQPQDPGDAASRISSLRVAAGNVDAVLRQAGESVAAARRLRDVAAEAADAAALLDSARAQVRTALRSPRTPNVTESVDAVLADAVRAATAVARGLATADRALQHANTGLVDAAQRLRTQPFEDACRSLHRVVRDVATGSGKSARLVVVGGELEVDRRVITALRDPLLHLVRNAVDHGLEPAPVRTAAGKPATGTVEVAAAVEGSMLRVTVRDDGAGIDTQALRAAAERLGLPASGDDVDLAFTSGLSSRTDVSDVSGRGVGLDAARARVEELGGSLSIASRSGSGTEVTLTSPVSLAMLRLLLVRAGDQLVALPSSSVQQVARVPRNQLREVAGAVHLTLHRRNLRAVALTAALGLPDPGTNDDFEQEHLDVVIPVNGDTALVTNGSLDELEAPVQPVPERLAGAPGVLGIAVIGDGEPALVVNPVAVARGAPPLVVPAPRGEDTVSARILLAEDTVTTRALERSILEAAGYAVKVAVDGADAWEQLQAETFDLLVSDVDMPRMSGFDLCRQIRSSARLRELPVVLVTSLDTSADRQRGLEAGADAYVVKAEFQQGTLLETIARLL